MLERFMNFLIGARFLRWLGRFAEDGVNSSPSTKRYGQLLAITVFAMSVVYLTFRIGLLEQWEALVWALAIVSIALLVLAGFGYLLGKAIERMNYNPPNPPATRKGKDDGGAE